MYRLPSALSTHLKRGRTLIVPTRQRSRAVQLAQAAEEIATGRLVWASADVLSPSAWWRRETERAAYLHPRQWPRLLSAAEEWYLWRECALEATQGLELLDGSAFADALMNAAQLAADYRIPLQAAAPGTEAALLFQTRRAFAARCERLGAASVSTLCTGLAPGDASSAPWLAGFDAVPPRLAACARAFVAPDSTPLAEPCVHLADDAQEESELIAAWCQERIAQDQNARLLVMLPGAHGPRERTAALIRQTLDPGGLSESAATRSPWVAIEGARPLGQQPMIAQALTTLTFVLGGTLDPLDLSEWLRASHWLRPQAPLRARLALALREAGLPRGNLIDFLGALQLVPGGLRVAARELGAQLARAQAALAGGSAAARSWSERFRAALAAAGWANAQGSSHAQETLLRWHELLEEFGELDRSAGAMSAGLALRVLRELCSRSSWRAPDDDASVTLSPMLADPVAQYDGIWVGGLDAMSFPQPPVPDPFIPLPAQLAAGVPKASPAGRLAQARTQLLAWRAGTAELRLSTPTRAQEFELLPSPLLKAGRQGLRKGAAWLPARLHRDGLTEPLIDMKGLPWDRAHPLPRGVRSLNLQNQCPFRAYAELRLGSLRPHSTDPGIPANRRGELLHLALQYLWEKLRDSHTLKAMTGAALGELIARSVSQALSAAGASKAKPRRRRTNEGQLDLFANTPPALARECRRAERLILTLCELERGRAPFRIAALESECQLALAGATLRMRIDRVDELEAGGRAVLDYKSGRRQVPDWYGQRPTHPQLLAYLCAQGEQVAALATVCVNSESVRFDGISRSQGMLPKVAAVKAGAGSSEAAWPGQRFAWRAILERLIGEFLAGDARVDPRPGACTFCHVIDICRIGEQGLPADASEEGVRDEE